jgi:putative hemolysin
VERPTNEQGVFGVTVVDGLLNLEDFEDDTGVELPEGPYETVAGFLIARLGRVPLLGDSVEEGDHLFEVTELDGRRASRVRVTRIARADAAPEGSPGDSGHTQE